MAAGESGNLHYPPEGLRSSRRLQVCWDVVATMNPLRDASNTNSATVPGAVAQKDAGTSASTDSECVHPALVRAAMLKEPLERGLFEFERLPSSTCSASGEHSVTYVAFMCYCDASQAQLRLETTAGARDELFSFRVVAAALRADWARLSPTRLIPYPTGKRDL